MSLDDPAKIAEALERLEQERERRIAAKVEAGQAIVVKLCAPATQDIAARKAHKLAELRSAGERREVIFNTLVFNTGVPRAGRDDDAATDNVPAAPKATKSDTSRAPFPNRYEHLAESLPKSPPPRPAARVPDMTEARPIKATIPPKDERDQGIVFFGSYTITGGQVHVADQDGRSLGSLPVGPNDDVELIARRLLKEKMAGNSSDFFGRINYPNLGIH